MKKLLTLRFLALISIIMGCLIIPTVNVTAAEKENGFDVEYPDELTFSIGSRSNSNDSKVSYPMPRVDAEENIYQFICPKRVSVSTNQEIIIMSNEYGCLVSADMSVSLEEDSRVVMGANSLAIRLEEKWNGVVWLKMNDDMTGIIVFSNDKNYVPEWASQFKFAYPEELTFHFYLNSSEDILENNYLMPRLDAGQNIYKLVCDPGVSVTPNHNIAIFGKGLDAIGGNGQVCRIGEDYTVTVFTNSLPMTLQDEWNGVVWLKMNQDFFGTIVFSNDKDFVPEWASHLNGVGDVTNDESTRVRYFDLKGTESSNPDKGIYVRISGDKTEKVVFY